MALAHVVTSLEDPAMQNYCEASGTLFFILCHATPALTTAPLSPTCPAGFSHLRMYGFAFWAWLGRGKMLPVRGEGPQPDCSLLRLPWLEKRGHPSSIVLPPPERDKHTGDQSETGLDSHTVSQFH